MRRADRLFDIIQTLRAAPRPLTAAALAEKLEVTVRTVYRDIAALQGSRVPIEGAAGIGYVLRRGFDLPPLMFTTDEVDARRRRRQACPASCAIRSCAKPPTASLPRSLSSLPDALRRQVVAAPFFVSEGSAPEVTGPDLAQAREAIRETRKM